MRGVWNVRCVDLGKATKTHLDKKETVSECDHYVQGMSQIYVIQRHRKELTNISICLPSVLIPPMSSTHILNHKLAKQIPKPTPAATWGQVW